MLIRIRYPNTVTGMVSFFSSMNLRRGKQVKLWLRQRKKKKNFFTLTYVRCIIVVCRFHDPWFGKYFDGDPSTGQMQDYSPLPVLHIHLMRLWTAWLEKYPEEFVNNPVIAVSVCDITLC